MEHSDHRRRVLSAGSISTDPVKNRSGDKIADVKDIMIDLPTGRVAYVVIAHGGVMGLGDKLFAIPWSAVQVDQEDHALVVDLAEDVLAAAPGFDKDNWPDFSNPEWARQVHDYYGVESDWLLT